MSWSNLNMQDSSSPLMEQLIFFYDYSMLIIIMIMILVSYMMTYLLLNNITNRFLMSGQMIEIIWTMIPAIVLIFIALPSLRLLYLIDEMSIPMLTLKSIGHQWFWSYEYSEFNKIEFDSYMLKEYSMNNFRLLDTDNHIIIPINMKVQMLITSSDVIHSWSMPSLGVKVDGVPGRLNQVNFYINRPGMFFGQCSEICGMNHSFMPIVIETSNNKNFLNWMKTFN